MLLAQSTPHWSKSQIYIYIKF